MIKHKTLNKDLMVLNYKSPDCHVCSQGRLKQKFGVISVQQNIKVVLKLKLLKLKNEACIEFANFLFSADLDVISKFLCLYKQPN